ncbi:MAG: hypothetical protein ACOC5R_03180 [Elusimicrobiota bacterium]
MKKFFCFIFIFIFCRVYSEAVFEDKIMGLGVIVGEPTGITFKTWTSPTEGVDGDLSWSFKEKSRLIAQIDFLKHNFEKLVI